MISYLLTCHSLTYAQRTVRVLERSGFTAQMLRTPKNIATNGCGYSVRFRANSTEKAISLLEQAGLKPGKVFIAAPGGQYREVGG